VQRLFPQSNLDDVRSVGYAVFTQLLLIPCNIDIQMTVLNIFFSFERYHYCLDFACLHQSRCESDPTRTIRHSGARALDQSTLQSIKYGLRDSAVPQLYIGVFSVKYSNSLSALVCSHWFQIESNLRIPEEPIKTSRRRFYRRELYVQRRLGLPRDFTFNNSDAMRLSVTVSVIFPVS
jgi:hypothetical protein